MAAFTGATQAIDQLLRGQETGNAAIDNAVENEIASFKILSVLAIGSLIAGIAGFFHWGASAFLGAVAGIVLTLIMPWGLLTGVLMAAIGAGVGLLAHGLFRVMGSASGGGGGGGSFPLSGGGGGGFRGGGGGFSGGGFTGGR